MYSRAELMNPVEYARLEALQERLYKKCKNLKADVKVPVMACFRYRMKPSHMVEEYLDYTFVAPNGTLNMADPGESLEDIREAIANSNRGKEVVLSRYYHNNKFMRKDGKLNVSSRQIRSYALGVLRNSGELNNMDYYRMSALMRLQYGRQAISPDSLGEYVECQDAETLAEMVADKVRECVKLTKIENVMLDYFIRPGSMDYELMQQIWGVGILDDDKLIKQAKNKMQIAIKRFVRKVNECRDITDDTFYAFLAASNFDFYRRGLFVPERVYDGAKGGLGV